LNTQWSPTDLGVSPGTPKSFHLKIHLKSHMCSFRIQLYTVPWIGSTADHNGLDPPPQQIVIIMEKVKVKLCLCGEGAVGKTSLIARYVHDVFDDKYLITLGTKVTKKEMSFNHPDDGTPVHITCMIWDVVGQQAYRSFMPNFYKNASGLIMVFDLTRRETFTALEDWRKFVWENSGDVPAIVLANKTDLKSERTVFEDEIKSYCDSYGMDYLLTSAKTGKNVNTAFEHIGKIISRNL